MPDALASRDELVRLAEKHQRQGRTDLAIEAYERLAQLVPTDWNVIKQLADLLERAGRREGAAARFRQCADHFFDEGFHPRASALYRKVLKLEPDSEHALCQLAEISLHLKLHVDARQALTKVLDLRRRRGDTAGAEAIATRLAAIEGAPARAGQAVFGPGDAAPASEPESSEPGDLRGLVDDGQAPREPFAPGAAPPVAAVEYVPEPPSRPRPPDVEPEPAPDDEWEPEPEVEAPANYGRFVFVGRSEPRVPRVRPSAPPPSAPPPSAPPPERFEEPVTAPRVESSADAAPAVAAEPPVPSAPTPPPVADAPPVAAAVPESPAAGLSARLRTLAREAERRGDAGAARRAWHAVLHIEPGDRTLRLRLLADALAAADVDAALALVEPVEPDTIEGLAWHFRAAYLAARGDEARLVEDALGTDEQRAADVHGCLHGDDVGAADAWAGLVVDALCAAGHPERIASFVAATGAERVSVETLLRWVEVSVDGADRGLDQAQLALARWYLRHRQLDEARAVADDLLLRRPDLEDVRAFAFEVHEACGDHRQAPADGDHPSAIAPTAVPEDAPLAETAQWMSLSAEADAAWSGVDDPVDDPPTGDDDVDEAMPGLASDELEAVADDIAGSLDAWLQSASAPPAEPVPAARGLETPAAPAGFDWGALLGREVPFGEPPDVPSLPESPAAVADLPPVMPEVPWLDDTEVEAEPLQAFGAEPLQAFEPEPEPQPEPAPERALDSTLAPEAWLSPALAAPDIEEAVPEPLDVPAGADDAALPGDDAGDDDPAAAQAAPPSPEPSPMPWPDVSDEIDLTELLDGLQARAPSLTMSPAAAPPGSSPTSSTAPSMRDGRVPPVEDRSQALQQVAAGRVFAAAGLAAEAARAFERASKDVRTRFEAASALADLHRSRGQLEDAVQWYDIAAQAPTPDAAVRRPVLYDLAETLEAVGEADRALAVLLDLLSEVDDYRDARARADRLLRVDAGG